jgi:ornithine cyclodeaminase
MSFIRVINADAVRRVLTIPDCIDAMEAAMIAVARRDVAAPLRQSAPLKDGSGHLGLMPGSALDPPAFGVKVLSALPNNPAAGRPMIQGFLVLFDHTSGAPRAIVDAAAITAIRTAAASGFAVKTLARQDARSHGVIGAGVQAAAHVEAILAAAPTIEETLVFARDSEKAQRMAVAAAARTGRRVRAVASAKEASGCDIVTTATAAAEPMLQGAWLKPGSHVNLIGSHRPNKREADTAAIARAEVYVDFIDSALAEAGDLLIPMQEGVIDATHIRGEIGAIAIEEAPGRSGPEAITLYKSLGVFAQDLFAAWRVLQRAEAADEGVRVPW